MSRGINKVILIGNLGADPEMRYMPSGNAVANISLVTSESWKDKTTGETQERKEWHRISFFNRLAEVVGEYCRSGSKIFVEGRLQTRKWQDQNGADRYTTEIIGNELLMLGGGSAMGGAQTGQSQAGISKIPKEMPEAKEIPEAKVQAPTTVPTPAALQEAFEDDMPF